MASYIYEAAMADASNAESAQSVRKRLDKERYVLAADNLLTQYRRDLSAAQTPKELKEIMKRIGREMSARFAEDEDSKAFWQENGGRLMEANRTDTEAIEQRKEFEFGRKSLRELLADAEDMLATATGAQGLQLLQLGLAEIEQSQFLSEDDRVVVRESFLTKGLLNLALNDAEAALRMAEVFPLAEKEALKAKIGEVSTRVRQDSLQEEVEAQRQAYISEMKQALEVWQQAENGEISPAAFYVLKQQMGEDKLWGEQQQLERPLFLIGSMFGKINQSGEILPEDVNALANLFICAYKNGKITFEQAAFWQNNLMQALEDEEFAKILIDDAIDEKIALVLGPLVNVGGDEAADDEAGSDDGAAFSAMAEAYVGEALNIYGAYYTKKAELAEKMQEKSARLAVLDRRKLAQQAWNGVQKEYGLKESAGEALSVEALQAAAALGADEALWRGFYQRVVYVEDKIGLLAAFFANRQNVALN